MKLLLIGFLMVSSAAAQANIITSYNSGDCIVSVDLVLPKEDAFAQALKDALINSPEMKEEVNQYSLPGTFYTSVGVNVNIDPKNIRFMFYGLQSSKPNIKTSDNFVAFDGKDFSDRLYRVLKASRSDQVKKYEERLLVRSGENMLSCNPLREDNSYVFCKLSVEPKNQNSLERYKK